MPMICCTMSTPADWATEEEAIFVLDMTTTQRIKPNKEYYADHSAKSCAYQPGATSSTHCPFSTSYFARKWDPADSGAKRNGVKTSGFKHPFQVRQASL